MMDVATAAAAAAAAAAAIPYLPTQQTVSNNKPHRTNHKHCNILVCFIFIVFRMPFHIIVWLGKCVLVRPGQLNKRRGILWGREEDTTTSTCTYNSEKKRGNRDNWPMR